MMILFDPPKRRGALKFPENEPAVASHLCAANCDDDPGNCM